MEIPPGTLLGCYEIRSLIGKGGMSAVYLARDTRLERPVALKVLNAELAADEEQMRRFVQEAKAAAALSHPNIAHVYEIGQEGEINYLAMEFIPGQTLRERLAGARVGAVEAIETACQIATALAAAHAAGIVHRDIKPENVMVGPDGHVKVLDFGLAKLGERKGLFHDPQAVTVQMVKTQPGVLMGTVAYMSPEQVRAQGADERTDIWSLGCILYELLAGRSPFEGATRSDIIAAILEHEPSPLTRFSHEVPAALEWIVMKALRKEREERYQSAREMLADLKKFNRGRAGEDDTASLDGPRRAESDRGVRHDTAPEVTLAHTASDGRAPHLFWAHHRKNFMFILAALLVAGAVFGLYRGLNQFRANTSSGHVPFAAVRASKLTTTGKVTGAAISPDGKYVAHALAAAGGQSLWVRQIATTSLVQVVPPAEVEYQGLAFSNDGDYVYYIVRSKNGPVRELYQVPVLGGPARKVVVDIDAPPTFSPDGKRMAFVRRYSSQGEDALIVAEADGNQERKIATRRQPDFFSTGGPAWSPEGDLIALATGTSNASGSYMTIIGISPENGAERPLTAQKKWFRVGRVAWLAKRSGLLVNAVEQTLGLYQIWHVPAAGGEARMITNGLSDYRGLSLAGDSGVMVTVQSDQLSSVWTAAREREGLERPRQLTSGQYDGYYGLSWAPDGKIFYATNASGNQDIWVMEPDGTGPRQLTVNVGTNVWPAASPDGRHVVFTSNRAGLLHIWRMDADGSNPLQLTHGEGEDWARFSPDGKWVIYTSIGGAKRFTLWKVPVDGGEPVALTDKLSLQAAISPDGRLIACGYRGQTDAPWRLALIPAEGGTPEKLYDLLQNVALPIVVRWTPDGREVTYIETVAGVSNLWGLPVETGQPGRLSDFSSEQIFAFEWSRDGKQLVYSRGALINDVVMINDLRRP